MLVTAFHAQDDIICLFNPPEHRNAKHIHSTPLAEVLRDLRCLMFDRALESGKESCGSSPSGELEAWLRNLGEGITFHFVESGRVTEDCLVMRWRAVVVDVVEPRAFN